MRDTRALVLTIVGTGLAVVTIVVAVLSMSIAGVNTRIDDLRDDVRSMNERLRAVEVGFGKVDQRLDTIERAILPRVQPADQ